jgi:OHCU decarboxylase
MKNTIETLNKASRSNALLMMSPLVECADWVSERAVDKRPFENHVELTKVLIKNIMVADSEQQLILFKGHPELAGSAAIQGEMTHASQSEQGRLGLLNLQPEKMTQLLQLNAKYRSRFGHPFIIALHRVADLETLFSIFRSRLENTLQEEHSITLMEIASVIEARTTQLFDPTTKNHPITSTNLQE